MEIIHPGTRTLLMDRMVMGYHALHRYDELVVRLKHLGVRPMSEEGVPEDRLLHIDEVYDWAQELVGDGVQHEQRSVCYYCGNVLPGVGGWCECYREVVIQDWYDLRDRTLIGGLPPHKVVTTSQCEDCGVPVPITARVVQKFHSKNSKGVYHGRRHCHTHWLQRRKHKTHN